MSNEPEAREILAKELAPLREWSHAELVARLLDREETFEVVGASGARYQVEIQAFWESNPGGAILVMGSIDDGSFWWAVSPSCDSFIKPPDGSGHRPKPEPGSPGPDGA
jgi:hypothetical protein